MDLKTVARTVGWTSLASGLAMMIAPRTMAKTYGLFQNRPLVRLLGLRDVVIGAGILQGDDSRWMRYRIASDAADTALIACKVVRGPDRPIGRLILGLGAVAFLCDLATRLNEQAHEQEGSPAPSVDLNEREIAMGFDVDVANHP